MKTIPTLFLFVLLLGGLSLRAESAPVWAARNPSGQPVRLAVPAPADPALAHLAWPKVIRTARDTIVLALCAGQGHNTGGSGPAIARSTDGGRTFSPLQVLIRFPDSDPRYLDCGNLALGVAPDGALLLLAMAFHRDGPNNIYGWRSTDDGVTWIRTDTSALGPDKTGSVFGYFVPLSPGELAVFGHYRNGSQPHTQGIWMATSRDQGLSWSEARRIADEHNVEPVVVRSAGRLIGFFRGDSQSARGRQSVGVSDDNGATWHTSLSILEAEDHSKARLAAPFAVENPQKPGELLVLTTERAVPGNTPGRIWLWRGDARSLDWKRERVLLEFPRVEGDSHTDFGYPWLLHLGGNRWQMYYYHGQTLAACPIWVTEVTL
jgi:hypothetical protein